MEGVVRRHNLQNNSRRRGKNFILKCAHFSFYLDELLWGFYPEYSSLLSYFKILTVLSYFLLLKNALHSS